MSQSDGKKKFISRFGRFMLRLLCVLLTTVLLVSVTLYGVMYVLCKGPSVTARDRFVMSVRETSAIGFLANWFFTDEQIAQIENAGLDVEQEKSDTDLIVVAEKTAVTDNSYIDPWGLQDDDGDGIVIDDVCGEGYVGKMMVIYDPSRVIVGCVPEMLGFRGYSVEEMVKKFDAVAGTNAGGFLDPEGMGDGSTPDSIIVFEGEMLYSRNGMGKGFIGIDADYKLHVGEMTKEEIVEANIQYGVCFGPALVINGEKNDESILKSGLNPRTAIGQRSDGAILLLVVDGRQASSLGASYDDLADIMLKYGAVNAGNLDGGSSTLMWYKDRYINSSGSIIGIRNVPTTILVLKESTK